MKGEWPVGKRTRRRSSTADAEELAVAALGRIVSDPDRLGRFLALTGLDPGAIRSAAAMPGFLPAVLGHVGDDENLLIAIASEISTTPDAMMEASRLLSPQDSDEWT